MNKYFIASVKLHKYLLEKYWNGSSMVGPTLGGKYYTHTIRLLRAYLPFISREKQILYQGLGYWIKSNWKLFDNTKDPTYMRTALSCSDFIVNSQSKEGNWTFPQHLMKRDIITGNGTWASLGLLETYKRTNEYKYLASALEWYDLLTNVVGFQKYKDSLVVNYANPPLSKVPNITTEVLWFFAELSNLTGYEKYLRLAKKLIRFLKLVQMKHGELMYTTEIPHYSCFQYNAFEFLDLFEFYRLTFDDTVYGIMRKLIKFISIGVNDENGSVRFNCFKKYPTIIYYAAAVGCSLLKATEVELWDFSELEEKVYRFVLSRQKSDGGFPYSMKEHLIFTDQTVYPYINEYLLYHLLLKAESLKL